MEYLNYLQVQAFPEVFVVATRSVTAQVRGARIGPVQRFPCFFLTFFVNFQRFLSRRGKNSSHLLSRTSLRTLAHTRKCIIHFKCIMQISFKTKKTLTKTKNRQLLVPASLVSCESLRFKPWLNLPEIYKRLTFPFSSYFTYPYLSFRRSTLTYTVMFYKPKRMFNFQKGYNISFIPI